MTNQSTPRARAALPRRLVLGLAGALGLLAAGLVLGATAPKNAAAQKKTVSPAVPVDALMKAGLRPDLVYGKADAKITIVEYASMTCPHCAAFHNQVFPELKKKYIDTGKAKLVFREFPLNKTAAGASMLARCAGGTSGKKTLAMIDVLFKTQAKWAFSGSSPVMPLFDVAKQFGFTETMFNKCLKDQKVLNALIKSRAHASDIFGVNSTPHFFVNGKRLKGSSLKAFEKVIDPLL